MFNIHAHTHTQLNSTPHVNVNNTQQQELQELQDQIMIKKQQQQPPMDHMGAVSRKFYSSSNDYSAYNITSGEDPAIGEDKYKRRSALSWLTRWIK